MSAFNTPGPLDEWSAATSIAEHLAPWPSRFQVGCSRLRALLADPASSGARYWQARGHGKRDDKGLGSFETKRYAFDGIDEVRCATLQRAKTTSWL